MKLYSIGVLCKGPTKTNLLKAAYELSSFSFFQRSSVQEFMAFTCSLIVERSACGSRSSVKEKEYMCHACVRDDGLSAVVVADSEYPQRVAFSLIDKVLEEFSRQVDSTEWTTGSPDTIRYTALDSYLAKYQNPKEADALTRAQAEVEETKVILHNTMESLLQRGEKLDDLVQRSEHLGDTSKAFYKTARKHNSCCKMIIQKKLMHLQEHRLRSKRPKSFCTTLWSLCCRGERSWMTWCRGQSTWEIPPKPSTRLHGTTIPAAK
ncbi:synaptobrevin homolog YKT6-like isoform X1 [Alosa sapidissima]|uniref:synaptobrevin homolog YKT6-like isoform X1 n=1 Tax=Alosa sapidissima TaxID=34773 RepID=UPI001C08FFB6|nr:synaptobrevin homolog YKT6-like isoform X1 [Alosa sapidissima]